MLLVADLADQWGIEPRTIGKTVYAEWALVRTVAAANPLVAVRE